MGLDWHLTSSPRVGLELEELFTNDMEPLSMGPLCGQLMLAPSLKKCTHSVVRNYLTSTKIQNMYLTSTKIHILQPNTKHSSGHTLQTPNTYPAGNRRASFNSRLNRYRFQKWFFAAGTGRIRKHCRCISSRLEYM